MRYYSLGVDHAGQSLTNNRAWAMYTAPRVDSNKYLASVPVDFGTNNTLDSLLGAHLARGLHAAVNDDGTGDELEFRDPATGQYQTYTLLLKNGEPTWWDQDEAATRSVDPGEGFWIIRKTGLRDRTNMVMIAEARTNTSVDIQITTNNMSDGWNWQVFGWPHDKALQNTGTVNALGFEPQAHGGTTARTASQHEQKGDQIWVWDEDSQRWRYYWLVEGTGTEHDGKWWDTPRRSAAVFDLEPGKAYFYRHHVGTNGVTTGTNFNWEAARP